MVRSLFDEVTVDVQSDHHLHARKLSVAGYELLAAWAHFTACSCVSGLPDTRAS